MVKHTRRPEPTGVAESADEFWFASEKLVEVGASWFSPKCVLAQRSVMDIFRGRATVTVRAERSVPNGSKLRMTKFIPQFSGSNEDKPVAQKGNSPDH